MAKKKLPKDHPLVAKVGPAGRPTAFKPFVPAAQQAIPPGLYDPVLDATLGQAKRGYQDVVQGAQTQALRLQTDYGLGMDSIGLGQTRGLEDLAVQEGDVVRSFARAGEDLSTAQAREGENYGMQVAGLERSYAQRAGQQRQQQNAYGVLRGGAALQAARKRAANMALDRQPLDVNHTRAGQDFARTGERMGQDQERSLAGIGTARTRLGEDSDLARGNLALQYAPPDANNPMGGRAWQDMGTSLATGARELGALGIDTERAKAYAAAQMGYVPPKPKHNEQTNPLTGGTTREYTINGIVYTVGKGGKILKKRRA